MQLNRCTIASAVGLAGVMWLPAPDAAAAASTNKAVSQGIYRGASTAEQFDVSPPLDQMPVPLLRPQKHTEREDRNSCRERPRGCPTGVKGDLNQDCKADLLFTLLPKGRHPHGNQSMDWKEDEQHDAADFPGVWIFPEAADFQEIVGADDFNGDGQSDLLFRDNSTGELEVWMMDGTTHNGDPIAIESLPLEEGWKVAATGDFNADGWPDLLWRNTDTGELVIWTMDGTTRTGEITPIPNEVYAEWIVVAALDYNNDGNRDLLWYNSESGDMVLWFMDDRVELIYSQPTEPANMGDPDWKPLVGGDYGVGDGGLEGTNDIVWRNTKTGDILVWYMDFEGNVTSSALTESPTMDPDGDPTESTDWLLVGPR